MPPATTNNTKRKTAARIDISNLDFPIADAYLTRYGGYVAHPKAAINQKGMAYFEEIEQDTHLKGCLETRAQQAIIPGWSIKPASDSEEDIFIAKFVEWNLAEIDNTFYQDLKAICDAMGKGFSVQEPIYEPITRGKYDGLIRLKDLKHIPAKYIGFDFDQTGKLKPDGLIYTAGFGTNEKKYRYSPQRFVYARFGNSDNPYGEGCDLDCAFWTWLKTMDMKFWAVFQEVFGSPLKTLKLPKNAKSEHLSEGQKILKQLQQKSGVTLPDGFILELLEAKRSGDVTYDNFVDRCNKEISKRILGSTLTMEGAGRGQAGGYALGQQHGQTTSNYAYADALWLEAVVNTEVIPKITQFNFENIQNPKFILLDDDISRLIGLAQSVQPLVQSGLKIPQDWVYDKGGIPKPKPDDTVLEPASLNSQPAPAGIDNKLFRFAQTPTDSQPEPNNFSQQDRLKLLDALESEALYKLQPAMEEIVRQTLEQIDKLPQGQIIGKVPDLKLNMGSVKTILTQFALLHYLYGKQFAAADLKNKGLQINPNSESPKISENFRLLEFKILCFAEYPSDLLAKLATEIPFTQTEIDKLVNLYQDRFFEVAGLLKNEINTVWKNQILALREGWTLRDFQKSLRDELIDLPANRTELIYRNWMNKSFSEGKDQLANDHDISEQVWGYTYRAILDSRVRESHAALDGTTLPKDDPFWKKYTPPWDYNCRCDREFVLQSEIDNGSVTPTTPN